MGFRAAVRPDSCASAALAVRNPTVQGGDSSFGTEKDARIWICCTYVRFGKTYSDLCE